MKTLLSAVLYVAVLLGLFTLIFYMQLYFIERGF